MPWPGPIDAAEKNITVQRLPESIDFRNREGMPLDNRSGGRRAPSDSFAYQVYLQSSRDRVVTAGVEQAIKVVTFHAIVIDELDMLHSHACQALCHDRADASSADNAELQPRELLLGMLAPC